jgi:RNA polymerase sigma-70 factor (ECF subfamily)
MRDETNKDPEKLARFQHAVLSHIDAAYNLARWLVRDSADAEDVLQESCLRAFSFFDGFQGGDGRAWLLAIVRNTSYTWVRKNRPGEGSVSFEENVQGVPVDHADPETLQVEKAGREEVHRAIEQLPPELREVVVLRELEDLSYKQIAAVAGVPLGTVMSRLSRARRRLLQLLSRRSDQESSRAV